MANMSTAVFVVLAAGLVLAGVGAEISTPTVENPLLPGRDVTAAAVNDPTVQNSNDAPNGVDVDQTFTAIPDGENPIAVGVSHNKPLVQGRKLLLASLELTGSGTQVGADGAGVDSVQSGNGQSDGQLGDVQNTHIQPHQDQTTVYGGGKSASTGFGVNPDNLAGDGPPVVYTTPGRK